MTSDLVLDLALKLSQEMTTSFTLQTAYTISQWHTTIINQSKYIHVVALQTVYTISHYTIYQSAQVGHEMQIH